MRWQWCSIHISSWRLRTDSHSDINPNGSAFASSNDATHGQAVPFSFGQPDARAFYQTNCPPNPSTLTGSQPNAHVSASPDSEQSGVFQ